LLLRTPGQRLSRQSRFPDFIGGLPRRHEMTLGAKRVFFCSAEDGLFDHLVGYGQQNRPKRRSLPIPKFLIASQ
jgi:hypothetical protein